MPSSLPRVIQPQNGVPKAPENSTLIQLGFTYGLNYPFVVSSSTAVAQIFSYLPSGISNGLVFDQTHMVMQYLQPYNTLSSLGYITTLAMAYIPSEMVDKLSLQLLNPNSDLYNNPDPSVKTLMSMIDPAIPVLAGTTLRASSANSDNPTPSSSGTDDDSPGGTDDNKSSSVRPSSVGIGLGVVCGAAVYGAAMFFVARRYKKRKAGHQRSSSVLTGSSGSSGAGAREATGLMSGGLVRGSYGSRGDDPQRPHSDGSLGGHGRESRNTDRTTGTGRTYDISGPVMAENSLGWN